MEIRVDIQDKLNDLADPVRAQGEKKYLKSPLKHYGVTVPELRKIAKNWLQVNKNSTINDVLNLSQQLWVGDYHEERMIAIFLLVYRIDELTFKHFPIIEKMVRESTGWAQLDMIAAWLCGQLYKDNQKEMKNIMEQWIGDNNFWVRRAALLTLLGPARRNEKDFIYFTTLATPLLSEKELFIRKAIGWVLREVSKVNPAGVYQYVKENKDAMSGLTFREATRKLPIGMQSTL